MGRPSPPPHRPHHCRWYHPLISGTWSWPTCEAMWLALTAAPRTLRPPLGAAQQAPQARHDPVADVVGGTAPAPQVAPPYAAGPREERRRAAPTEAPRRAPEPAQRRSHSRGRGTRGRHRGRDYNSPGRDDGAAYRWSYRTPERYGEPPSERRASGGPATAARCSNRAVARRDDRPRRGTPDTAPRGGPTGGGTTPTGADVGPLTLIAPGACAMMRQTQGAGMTGSPERLPAPALRT